MMSAGPSVLHQNCQDPVLDVRNVNDYFGRLQLRYLSRTFENFSLSSCMGSHKC